MSLIWLHVWAHLIQSLECYLHTAWIKLPGWETTTTNNNILKHSTTLHGAPRAHNRTKNNLPDHIIKELSNR